MYFINKSLKKDLRYESPRDTQLHLPLTALLCSFRLPKDFVARIQDLSDNADSPDIIMDEDAKEVDNDKKSANADKDFFPLPKEAIYHNQAAILVKFVSNFLIQLELISSPTTVTNLVGKKIFASRNRFYTREGLVMKAKGEN